MAKGLKLPIQATPAGRLATVEGSAQLRKIVKLNLSDLENTNPYNQWRGASHGEPGIDPGIIFALTTNYLRAKIKRSIKSLFQRLEAQGRAKLDDGYPIMSEDPENQDLLAEIKYIDLETDKPDEFTQRFSWRQSP